MYPIKTRTLYDPTNLWASLDTFTTVYLGNYLAGDFEEGGGSHPGVDIVPMVPGDQVVSVLSGIVYEAKENPSEGKFVIIQHDQVVSGGKSATYYSCYLHLSNLNVAKGDTVSEGTVIGTSWNTGISTGEHLHFQIDTAEAPFHPYWPFNFKEARDLNLSFMEAVNRGLGIENARKYTVNPLVFLSGAKGGTVSAVTKPVEAKIASTPTIPVASAPVGFTDVSPTHPNARAIWYLKSEGISLGQSGKFYPTRSITRAELVKMAYAASKGALSTDTRTYFSDVSGSSPFLSFINTARASKAVNGYWDGTFRPDALVTRAEGLKILLTILAVQTDPVNGPVYADVGRYDWVAPYAFWSRDNDVLEPSGSNFTPNSQLTRAEVAEIIYRAKGN